MKKRGLVLFISIGVLSLFVSCTSGRKGTPVSSDISIDSLKAAEATIQSWVDEGKIAGFSTLVIKNGQEVQRANIGYANIENQKPLESDAIFRIFSMTKPVTAVALMTLFDEGKFQLDDKVSKYIPEFEEIKVYTPTEDGFTLEPQQNEMTIRNLLTHTSGISYGWDYDSYVDSVYRARNVGGWDGTIGEKMKLLGDIPLNFQPGTEWKYGLSIDVAGYLVEVFSGEPMDEYFRKTIFEPLKMKDAGFYVPENKHDRLCDVYNVDENGVLKLETGGLAEGFKHPVTLFSGGGGMVASIDDYARFCQMLLNGGELDDVRILSEDAVNLIMTNQLPETATYDEGKTGFGLSGTVNPESGEYSWAGMASTNFWINPETDLIIISCTQLLPSNFTYGNEFKKMVENALIQ
ncbi:serine hydrolase domain-containing protein [uncultured Draconibacterium sp.]|uniref:serine hydrolase domain-containing protein n=1 Tax=uncultured Draconibacterium sp. TaxID=1573823 RepID=UPI003216F60E